MRTLFSILIVSSLLLGMGWFVVDSYMRDVKDLHEEAEHLRRKLRLLPSVKGLHQTPEVPEGSYFWRLRSTNAEEVFLLQQEVRSREMFAACMIALILPTVTLILACLLRMCKKTKDEKVDREPLHYKAICNWLTAFKFAMMLRPKPEAILSACGVSPSIAARLYNLYLNSEGEEAVSALLEGDSISETEMSSSERVPIQKRHSSRVTKKEASSLKEEPSLSSVKEEESTTSSLKEESTTSSLKEESSTSSLKEESSTSSLKEEDSTSALKEEEEEAVECKCRGHCVKRCPPNCSVCYKVLRNGKIYGVRYPCPGTCQCEGHCFMCCSPECSVCYEMLRDRKPFGVCAVYPMPKVSSSSSKESSFTSEELVVKSTTSMESSSSEVTYIAVKSSKLWLLIPIILWLLEVSIRWLYTVEHSWLQVLAGYYQSFPY